MKTSIKSYLVFLLLTVCTISHADEGMWFPQLLQQMNASEMRLKGLQIPIDEIYNINKSSLKDAVVQFGGGCTGELISAQGLLLTNHHCGFSYIQDNSSLDHNYLKDGFWAKTMQEEIPCPGLTATFVISIIDVTAEFNKVLTEDMSEAKRNDLIKELSAQLEKRAVEGTNYEARVRQFFSGNEFYIITTQTFKDVRLVGAPPSSIGNFGGDSDNWLWPRYTGDFSMFRVYADRENKPSEYKNDNIPFKPKFFFPISISGVQQDDFTMVYGFPGRTQEYISAAAMDLLVNTTDPNRVMVRTERLSIIDDAMRSSEAIHIQYAAKQRTLANGWKKWQGEVKGLKQTNAFQRKLDFEIDFQNWAEKTPVTKLKYGNVLASLEKLYTKNHSYLQANDFYSEAVFGIEVINYVNGFKTLMDVVNEDQPDIKKIHDEAEKINKGTANYFKDYHLPTDQLMMSSLLSLFDKQVVDSLKPKYITDLREKYNGDFTKLASDIFKKSIFVSQEKMNDILTDFNVKKGRKIKNDPCYILTNELATFYRTTIASKATQVVNEAGRLNRIFLAGQRQMQPDKKFYPDANSTLRLTYGQVRGYEPRDGVNYLYQTTLDGLIEKYIPGNEEFDVPAKLLALYNAKDYGRYGVNGKMSVAFLATNHTTGGNSGSPVLNAKGQLIGTNFDRVWEGTMSDVLFNPEVCRNITLDIRYTLFIVEKFAGAQRLIDEMEILN